MRKLLLVGALALTITGVAMGITTPWAKGTLWCSDVVVQFPPTAPGPYVKQGTTLTASNTGDTCQGNVVGYIWKRNGTAISGATAQTYTTTSADAGDVITVRITGTIQSEDSVNSAHVLGSSSLDDEFNGASGTDPSSSIWNAATGPNNQGVTYGGWNNMDETGNGLLEIFAQYEDQDGDGHSTSATDTDAATETVADGAATDWTTGGLTTKSPYLFTGSRWVEARIQANCVDNDTGWTSSNYGWETSAFQDGGVSGNDMEIDFYGMHSKTTLHAGTSTDDADNDSDSYGNDTDSDASTADLDSDSSGENDSNPGDYLSGAGAISHVSPGDADNDGDSYGAGDTDSSVTTADGDNDTDPADITEDTTTETSDGVKGGGSNYESPTKLCGSWHTYAALIEPHKVTYYQDGFQIYDLYTSSTYGTPNLGLSSTYDFTTLSMSQTLNVAAFQSPPQSTATFFMFVDYIHVNALS